MDLVDAYMEKFRESPPIFNLEMEVAAEGIQRALDSGKKMKPPRLPKGALI